MWIKEFSEYSPLLKASIIVSFVLVALLFIGAILSYVLLNKKKPLPFTTRDLTYGAVCLAIGFALSFFGYKMPQGGTLTPAATLPIMIYCYFFGFRKGFIVVFAYMLLQFLQSPSIVHPMSAVLDYVIPYMALIVLSVFCKKKNADTNFGVGFKANVKYFTTNHYKFLIGVLCYVVLRYFSHILSGVIFYGEWAWEGWGVWAYSFAYNSYVLIDAMIALIAGVCLLSSKAFNRLMTVSANTLQNTNASKENN